MVIIIAVLLIGILLAIVTTLSSLFSGKIELSADTKNSVSALYAAESGMEWCLYFRNDPSAIPPVMSNGATYTLTPPDCSSLPIKSVGNYRKITRAVEVSF